MPKDKQRKAITINAIFNHEVEAASFRKENINKLVVFPNFKTPLIEFQKQNRNVLIFAIFGEAKYLEKLLSIVVLIPATDIKINLVPHGAGLDDKPFNLSQISVGKKWLAGKGRTAPYENFAYHKTYRTPIKTRSLSKKISTHDSKGDDVVISNIDSKVGPIVGPSVSSGSSVGPSIGPSASSGSSVGPSIGPSASSGSSASDIVTFNQDCGNDLIRAPDVQDNRKTQKFEDEKIAERLYRSMQSMNTEDEGTKRFLLGLHYMNEYSKAREITFHANSGDITFLK